MVLISTIFKFKQKTSVGLALSLTSSLALSPMAQAAVEPLPIGRLQKTVNRLVEQSKIKKSKLGLIVATSGGEALASLNSETSMTPASVTKIVTAAAILEKMPIGQQFLTKLLATNEPSVTTGALEGDLYLQGGGDPGFVSESMWCLVNDLLRTDIKSVHGDIVVDDSFFDATRFDANRDQTRVDRAYDSPIGAMTFNWSAVSVYVRPGRKAGEPARVFIDPENEYIQLSNHAKTVASGATKIETTNEAVTKKVTDGHEIITVSGQIAVGADEFVAYKSITQPEIWAASQLKSFLKQRGVSVSGTVRAGHVPASAKTLATNKSKPVPELVTEMMKFSNNYIAEILTKDLGALIKGPPGTMEKGMVVINDYLKEAKLNPDQFTLQSPSGLSRKNQFRPVDLLHILEHVRKRFQVYPEYAVSLPIGGVDGTLRKRLKGGDLEGVVRAKTGHLAGVVGLGGYAGADDGQVYEFLFLYNGEAEESDKAKKLFDSIVAELLKAEA